MNDAVDAAVREARLKIEGIDRAMAAWVPPSKVMGTSVTVTTDDFLRLRSLLARVDPAFSRWAPDPAVARKVLEGGMSLADYNQIRDRLVRPFADRIEAAFD